MSGHRESKRQGQADHLAKHRGGLPGDKGEMRVDRLELGCDGVIAFPGVLVRTLPEMMFGKNMLAAGEPGAYGMHTTPMRLAEGRVDPGARPSFDSQ